MNQEGVNSNDYAMISKWLLSLNDSILYLKDIFYDKIVFSVDSLIGFLKVIDNFLNLITNDKEPTNEQLPIDLKISIHTIFESEPEFYNSVTKLKERIRNILEQLKNNDKTIPINNKDFEILDRIAEIVSDNATETFKKIWRHR